MTGIQLADAVSAGAPDLPLLLVTGYAEIPSDAGGKLARLGKPFREEQLVRAIVEVMAEIPGRSTQVFRFPPQ